MKLQNILGESMKIIFNYRIDDWKVQILQELQKSYDVIIPENFLLKKSSTGVEDFPNFNFEGLLQCVKENPDAAFIFSFFGDIRHLINWEKLHIDTPIIDFWENTLNRPYIGLRSAFVNLWYDERFAQPLLERFNRNNLIFAGMAANPYIFHPLQTKKKYDISFIGQPYGERGYYIKKLNEFAHKQKLVAHFPRASGSKFILTYENINEIYNQSKINIAFAPKEQPGRIINLRSYEICMSGNFQLVQYTPCLEEFFEYDNEIAGWKNTKDLITQVRYYLNNPDERERIAKKGYERAIKQHTWTHRFSQVRAFLEDKKKLNISSIIAKNIFNLPTGFYIAPTNFKNLNSQNSFNLETLGYNAKRNIKKKLSIKIHDIHNSFLYKPDLRRYWFIEIMGIIMMVLYLLPTKRPIVRKDWENLLRIRTLIQNFDLTTPTVGLVTNTEQCLCFDFQMNHWLKEIPNKALLTAKVSKINWLVDISLVTVLTYLKRMKDPLRNLMLRIRNRIRYVLRYTDWKRFDFLKIDWTSIWILLFGI